MEQESLLTDIEYNPVLATTGQRFVNYLIDLVVFYALLFLLGVVLGVTRSSLVYESQQTIYPFKLQLLALLIIYFYYVVCELFLKGKTIGKFVTGTKAVNENGSDMDAKTVLLRTLCRLVPFEPFSAFGARMWHDKWVHTYVIDVKKTEVNSLSVQ